jgi:hypothetical protein
MQSEVKNRNGRIYPKAVLEKALHQYNANYVLERRALGELNHPEDRAQVDPTEACIIIESLSWHGNDIVGKARVLTTPKGQIVKSLLEGGWKGGVSSRATGSLKRVDEANIVQPDLQLWAVDVVDGPSAPSAYVNSLYEQHNAQLSIALVEYINSLKINKGF